MSIPRCSLSAGLLTLAAVPALAQAPDRGAFVVRRGTDAVATERFSRTADQLEGEITIRAAGLRLSYTATLAPAAQVRATPMQRGVATLHGDTVLAEVGGAVQRFASRRGALPFLNASGALLEQALRRARILGGDAAQVPLWRLEGGQTVLATITRLGPDSALLVVARVDHRLAVDSAGRVLGVRIPAQGATFERTVGLASAKPSELVGVPCGAR